VLPIFSHNALKEEVCFIMTQQKEVIKVGVGGYIALGFAILVFSGFFMNVKGPLHILDLTTLTGQFGKIVKDAAPGIQGSGGTGVRNGFFQSLSIAPGVFLAVAFITVIEHYKGLEAARKLLTPFLRPLMGIGGACGLAMISNWQSSDTGAAVARTALDSGLISSKERDILLASQFVGAAVVGMLFSNGALLFPYLTVAPGVILLLVMVLKLVAGNLMRLYILFFEREKPAKVEAEKHG
jgi:nucleoside recognition membrane protein YjiH